MVKLRVYAQGTILWANASFSLYLLRELGARDLPLG